MCGIVGYLGSNNGLEYLLKGLKRLEYRGYDSVGISTIAKGKLETYKSTENIDIFSEKALCFFDKMILSTAIGHTRWATHGKAETRNSHPHHDCKDKFSIVHNGIIENYQLIKEKLINKGFTFSSDTDTEVVANLLLYYYEQKQDLTISLRKCFMELEGAYSIAIIDKDTPNEIYFAKKGSPLIVGKKNDDWFLASDISAFTGYCESVSFVDDYIMGKLYNNGDINCTNFITEIEVSLKFQNIVLDESAISKCGYKHFMLKEIFEQEFTLPKIVHKYIGADNSIKMNGFKKETKKKLNECSRIVIVSCGTSYHASLIGEYLIESYCRIPVEIEVASEYIYKDPVVYATDIVIGISQSGETADTLSALKKAKQSGAYTMGICNVPNSTITRQTDDFLLLDAGQEISVASTKVFSSQVLILLILTLYIAELRKIKIKEREIIIDDLHEIYSNIKLALGKSHEIEQMVEEIANSSFTFFLGRNTNFPIAMEGALKLKEVAYNYCEAHALGEMKHGPLALIDKNLISIVIATNSPLLDKINSNIEEIKARDGKIISIISEGNSKGKSLCDYSIVLPKVHHSIAPIINIIPLQLLAYYTALHNGCNIDKPRNLAKSVTVE